MQFSQIIALAVAATATVAASPVEARTVNSCQSGSPYCKAEAWDKATNTCKSGGVVCCQSAGILNILNCVSILDQNMVKIPITLNLLDGPITL